MTDNKKDPLIKDDEISEKKNAACEVEIDEAALNKEAKNFDVFNPISVDASSAVRDTVKRYLKTCFAALIVLIVFALISGLFNGYVPEENPADKSAAAFVFRKLSDVFVVGGVVFLAIAGFTFCSRAGAFDMIAFGVRQAVGIVFKKPEHLKYKDFYEYKEAKSKKEKGAYSHFLWVGLALLIIGIILLFVYYSVNK